MRSLELFAGCGGLAFGMARAGFTHEKVVEYDNDSIVTLLDNKRRNVKHVRHWGIEKIDAREIDYRALSGIDVISGGPPCQPFSIGGRHLGPRDPRNMWPEAIRAVREIAPKAFVLENVRGLMRPDFSPYRDYIILQLSHPDLAPRREEFWEDHLVRLRQHASSKAGGKKAYRVLAKVINAADYGAAQKRHRAIFIGVASEFGERWQFPATTHSQEALAWTKHVDGTYWRNHSVRRLTQPSSPTEARIIQRLLDTKQKPTSRPWKTIRDVIHDLPTATKTETIAGHWQHPGAKVYPNHTGSCIDEPAKALKAGDHGVPGGENMVIGPRGAVRYFTVREMARLQGFPDEYNISGSWKAATRQLGNAVPTGVAEVIGRAVHSIISAT